MSSELIPHSTIDAITRQRVMALVRYRQAWAVLRDAHRAQGLAGGGEMAHIAIGLWSRSRAFGVGDRGKFFKQIRQEIDRGVWSQVMNTTKLEQLMDHKAREQFRQQLRDDPPKATSRNIRATLQQFAMDSGAIWRRGVAEAFSHLDRRFRSHDGFKIGARVVLSYAFEAYGSFSTRARERLRDVERAVYLLDGKAPPDHYDAGITGLISRETHGLERRAFTVQDEYFRLVAYKNGNAHVWFKRDDLVEKVNLLLAEHYGATLGAGADAVDRHAHTRSTAVAKNMGWFASPPSVVDRLIERGGVHTQATYRGEYPRLRILEPSAGEGAIAMAAAKYGHDVRCVELHPARAIALQTLGLRAMQDDFLNLHPDALGLYDRVLMNPPFDRGMDIDHVRHAFTFLKPGGTLAAVMSAGTEFREDARTVAFREWVQSLQADRYRPLFDDLPAGSFKDSGTMVNACIVVLRKPGAA